MPRKGENIYKRKDGRWEARYIYSFKEDGSPRYRSIYAADYLTVKKKQNDAKRKMDPRLFQSVRMRKNISFYGLLWLERLKPSSKESTYVRYHYLFSHYISPMIGDRLVYTFSNKDCEVFLNRLLVSGKSDGSGLAPKTVTDIRSVVKLILKTAEKEGELSLCNPELCPVKPVRKPLRILSLKEQQALQDYLLGNLTHKNIGTLIALYTGVRLGELCAMQWKDIHFQEQYLEISKTLHRVTFIDNSEDYFFTFNYTSVLERIYRVPSNHILHIHGGLYPYCDEPPILGHGNVKKIKEYREKAERAAEEYDEGKESIYNAVANYYERTFKNTNECMSFRGIFFRQLTEVNNVEIIGHSFGEVDMPYFTYLKYCISKNAKWKFYYHSSEDYNAAEKAVKELELDIGDYEILPSDCFWQ